MWHHPWRKCHSPLLIAPWGGVKPLESLTGSNLSRTFLAHSSGVRTGSKLPSCESEWWVSSDSHRKHPLSWNRNQLSSIYQENYHVSFDYSLGVARDLAGEYNSIRQQRWIGEPHWRPHLQGTSDQNRIPWWWSWWILYQREGNTNQSDHSGCFSVPY